MAGIYIHIPYCRKACIYCNFHFSTTIRHKTTMVNAIVQEIKNAPNFFPKKIEKLNKKIINYHLSPIDSIYFGGGTPSLLSSDELQMLLDAVYQSFEVTRQAEITLETNPDDHTVEKLHQWKTIGINRLSIGVQSFFEEDLTWMNRTHTAEQSIACIHNAQQTGFSNLTIDLIYGIPGLSDERWKYNFDKAAALDVSHLSCYALTVEPKTTLNTFITQKHYAAPDTEQQARQFLLLMDWATGAAFEHYEISNFAKPGYRSRHNTAYWQGKPYFGFGPSAHSFDGHQTRWWNIANNALYIQSIHNNQPYFETEILTPNQQLNEYIMTALRTKEGIEMEGAKWDLLSEISFLEKIKKWEKQGKLLISDKSITLTNEGKLFADGIAADLFII